MYAQTIAYGLLSARVAGADTAGSRGETPGRLPVTNPFLRELMQSFLIPGPRSGGAGPELDFDELGVEEVVELLDLANMEAVIEDFGDRNPLEDPVIHFYEVFLSEYDSRQKIQRGVFYTPPGVVSFIVRSVHELIRRQFGLPLGLADTSTWQDILAKHPGMELPPGVDPRDVFVQILDPATGTGTFLVEAIDVIHQTMDEAWSREGQNLDQRRQSWNAYVPRYLLTRLHGFELMMAPYAIAHLKVGLKLYETGYDFSTPERARIYLTNALDPAVSRTGQFDFAVPALAHEAEQVNAVKQGGGFTIVLGNPPYSIQSANLSQVHRALVDRYRFVDGERIRERGALQFEKNIQDDYVKFFALAEDLLASAPMAALRTFPTPTTSMLRLSAG
jgi:predicted helicase